MLLLERVVQKTGIVKYHLVEGDAADLGMILVLLLVRNTEATEQGLVRRI